MAVQDKLLSTGLSAQKTCNEQNGRRHSLHPPQRSSTRPGLGMHHTHLMGPARQLSRVCCTRPFQGLAPPLLPKIRVEVKACHDCTTCPGRDGRQGSRGVEHPHAEYPLQPMCLQLFNLTFLDEASNCCSTRDEWPAQGRPLPRPHWSTMEVLQSGYECLHAESLRGMIALCDQWFQYESM